MALTRIDRMVIGQVLRSSAMVLAVVGVLSGLFLFIDNQHDVGVGQFSVKDAACLAMILLPSQLVQLMPLAVLIGTLLGLGQLARENAWVVVRSVGVSPWRLALAAAGAGLMLGGAALVVGELMNPPLIQWADQWRAEVKGSDPQLITGSVVWVRDGHHFIRIQRPSRGEVHSGVDVFDVQRQAVWPELSSVDHAQVASIDESGHWQLKGVDRLTISDAGVDRKKDAAVELPGSASAQVVSFAALDPDGLAITDLLKQIDFMRENGQQTQALELSLHNRMSHAAASIFLGMLGVVFVLGTHRGGLGADLAKGIGVGLLYFLMTRTVETGGSVYGWSAPVVAFLPLVILALVTTSLLVRAR